VPAAVSLTLAEAATILNPPITEQQLRTIIRALRITPAGWRHPGSGRGHPIAAYPAAEIFRLHAALSPWLASVSVPAGN
jgi:hypothetical protein